MAAAFFRFSMSETESLPWLFRAPFTISVTSCPSDSSPGVVFSLGGLGRHGTALIDHQGSVFAFEEHTAARAHGQLPLTTMPL